MGDSFLPQPAGKGQRFSMSTIPSQSQQQVGGSSNGESTESSKRKKPQLMDQQSHKTGKRQKSNATSKRFKPPMAKSPVVTPITRSPMLRLAVSPLVMGTRSPAYNWQRSPSPLPMHEKSPSLPNEETTNLISQDLGKSKRDKHCIPVILDPRFKFGFIDYRLKQAFQECAVYHIERVDKALRALFTGYSSHMGVTANHSSQGNDTAVAPKGRPWSEWGHQMNAQKNQVTNEVDRYLQDDLFPWEDDDFDILHWWKMHSSKYPTVACMACDVLAVPASTVPSESTFSMSGRIINDYRTRLSGDSVEALIYFQDWLRNAGPSYLDIISVDNLEKDLDDMDGDLEATFKMNGRQEEVSKP